VWRRSDLDRQARLAVAAAEQVLAGPVRRVLDLGAGEGRWQPAIRRLRPRATYIGIDASEWAVGRWGARRGIHLGSIEQSHHPALRGRYDLVIAADVLHYLSTPALRRAARTIAFRTGAIALLPTFVTGDAIVGDRHAFQRRSARTYRRILRHAGLVEIGLFLWTTGRWRRRLAALEIPGQ
jgi:SAM-dependent methyltransferase